MLSLSARRCSGAWAGIYRVSTVVAYTSGQITEHEPNGFRLLCCIPDLPSARPRGRREPAYVALPRGKSWVTLRLAGAVTAVMLGGNIRRSPRGVISVGSKFGQIAVTFW